MPKVAAQPPLETTPPPPRKEPSQHGSGRSNESSMPPVSKDGGKRSSERSTPHGTQRSGTQRSGTQRSGTQRSRDDSCPQSSRVSGVQVGHDTTGTGYKPGGGQAAQAKDRDFDRAFCRCSTAIATLEGAERARSKAHRELGQMVHHVDAMLHHTRALFDDTTARTIVSLNQLATALEAAAGASVKYSRRPLLPCGRAAWDAAGQAALQEHARALEAYATAMLLEHGFRASDLRLFAARPRASAEGRERITADVFGSEQVGSIREEGLGEAADGEQADSPAQARTERHRHTHRAAAAHRPRAVAGGRGRRGGRLALLLVSAAATAVARGRRRHDGHHDVRATHGFNFYTSHMRCVVRTVQCMVDHLDCLRIFSAVLAAIFSHCTAACSVLDGI